MKNLIQNAQNKTWFETLVEKEEKKNEIMELSMNNIIYVEENPERSRTDGINFVQNLLNTQISEMRLT
mgnify:CR=1 FL=1